MFTVLIQNEKTLNSFYDHLPIFNGFLQSEEMKNRLRSVNGMNLEGRLKKLFQNFIHSRMIRAAGGLLLFAMKMTDS